MNNLFGQKKFKIIHIDMDCFYAQVEMRDDPSLKDKPVAIGGPSKTKGVLCTSNYKAREYGVRSAQPTFKAFKLCPQLVLIPPNFHKYEEISRQVKEIFYKYTDKVETVSLDEAYLDVTDCEAFGGSATLIAKAIKDEIFEVTKLTASAGVSFNKMLAKIASDWKKPNGLFVITPDMRESFMETLELSKLPGIGKVSFSNLERRGLKTCGDITKRDLHDLFTIFSKKNALDLYERAMGISNSVVESKRKRKSFGIERTFYESMGHLEDILDVLDEVFKKFQKRLTNINPYHLEDQKISHVFVKIRFSDFQTQTKEVQITQIDAKRIKKKLELGPSEIGMIKEILTSLIKSSKKDVRLVGFGIRFKEVTHEQLSLMA